MEGGARRDGATLQMGRQVREIDGVRKRERERNRERQTKGERERECERKNSRSPLGLSCNILCIRKGRPAGNSI